MSVHVVRSVTVLPRRARLLTVCTKSFRMRMDFSIFWGALNEGKCPTVPNLEESYGIYLVLS